MLSIGWVGPVGPPKSTGYGVRRKSCWLLSPMERWVKHEESGTVRKVESKVIDETLGDLRTGRLLSHVLRQCLNGSLTTDRVVHSFAPGANCESVSPLAAPAPRRGDGGWDLEISHLR